MRFYAIGNMYLSSIQQGIQAFHCLGDTVVKYSKQDPNSYSVKTLSDWMTNHKTLICLNGGNANDLGEMHDFLQIAAHKNPYPWGCFCEDERSLGGVITCVGIVLPEEVYSVELDETESTESLTPWELELMMKLKRMPTAR